MNKINFKTIYSQSWNYLVESKNFIYSIIFIFILFSLISFFLPVPDILKNKILELIKELAKQTQNLSQFDLIVFIFLNNLKISFLALVFGIFLGIFPMIIAISNGYLLGFVSFLSVNKFGIFSLSKLLPHGIFELPALFISLGLGLKLGVFIFEENKRVYLERNLLKSLIVFLFIVVPLLLVAAIIEGSLIFLLH